jgi:hypothetical protein
MLGGYAADFFEIDLNHFFRLKTDDPPSPRLRRGLAVAPPSHLDEAERRRTGD